MIITRYTRFDDLPELLPVEEYAIFCDISRASAYLGVRKGEIPSIKIGGTLRVPREAIKA